MLGRGYYVTGLALDVPGRPDRREGVLPRPADRGKCEKRCARRCPAIALTVALVIADHAFAFIRQVLIQLGPAVADGGSGRQRYRFTQR